MSNPKKALFVTADGRNLFFIFALVSSLFCLWGLLNGMIDVMDKHFQDYLHLSKSDSAWIQFAHYLGYFLMAIPAAFLAKKLGYKAGIIAGLALTAAGCLWLYPATHIDKFWAILFGVCVIAMGLTFLETVANPYTTVLGSPEYGATRINLAQSFNGVGWILGPIVCGMFIYSQEGLQAAHQRLWIPYAGIAVGVIILIGIFSMIKLPDLVGADTCHIDEDSANSRQAYEDDRKVNRPLSYLLMVLNAAVLIGICAALAGFLLTSVFDAGARLVGAASRITPLVHLGDLSVTKDNAPWILTWTATAIATVLVAIALIPAAMRIHNKSIWSHPHFASFTLAQFLYVAAQAGIFSFFINYVVAEIPAVGERFSHSMLLGGQQGVVFRDGTFYVNELGATKLLSVGYTLFMLGRFCGSAILRKRSAHATLGVYCFINSLLMVVVFLKIGWLSLAALLLSFFFMSIMFPTIFALGIYGLGSKAKMASSFIVMGITGGAMMPKVMGWVGDHYNMSQGFIVPLVCFGLITVLSFAWPLLSGASSLTGVSTAKGH